jgi:hypothetical protein
VSEISVCFEGITAFANEHKTPVRTMLCIMHVSPSGLPEIFYSLLETAKLRSVDPARYLGARRRTG